MSNCGIVKLPFFLIKGARWRWTSGVTVCQSMELKGACASRGGNIILMNPYYLR